VQNRNKPGKNPTPTQAIDRWAGQNSAIALPHHALRE